MKKIMFLCHGNICRSPMAEFVMKDLVRKAGRESEFLIDSGAVSTEEIGNDVYPNTKSLLYAKGVRVGEHAAHQITRAEFDEFDLIIVMDQSNIARLSRIVGEAKVYDSGKVHLLMEYAEGSRSVSGAVTGSVSGSTSGAVSGSTSGAVSGSVSGSTSGAVSGSASGSTSGARSRSEGQFAYPNVADPWYTRDFERSYQDILAGCEGLLKQL